VGSTSPQLAVWFDDYARYHTTRGNKICHCLGIPAIVLALLGMLSHLHLLGLDGSQMLIAGTSLFYLRLDRRLGIPFIVSMLGLRSIALHLCFTTHVWLFVLGWVAQFVGHYVYEKKSPAFLTNIQHLLVGPLWIFALACGA
jgi:uncharacterized membrane protein YGL010W